MATVYNNYPGDLDVACIYADSLLVLKPWAMWVRDPKSGDIVPANASTLVAKDVLEKVKCLRVLQCLP